MNTITIATRASDLALWQAYHVKNILEANFPKIEVKLNKIVSKGDKILNKPLALIGGKGHFTKELEEEMLAGNADMAVHSLKDVPSYMPDGLELVAVSKRQEQSDVFLSHKYNSFEDLPKGAVVGTTSLRRRMQLLAVRPDLKVKDLRGNVNTRLRKLAEGEYDAIILAFIGVSRLDLIKDVPFSQKLPLTMMIPPMGQASLGIQIIAKNSELREMVKILNDEDSFLCAKLERDFVAKIEVGCSAPVAVNAIINGDEVSITSMIGLPDGSEILKKEITSTRDLSDNLGDKLAQIMVDNGAIELLKKAEKLAFKDEMPERL